MTPTKTEPLEAQMQSTTSVDLRAMAGAPKGTSGVRTVPLGMLHRTADEIDDLAAALRQIVSEMAPDINNAAAKRASMIATASII